jgi:prepilin-type N-terminal cleavage/methylation domain-containing protein
MLSRLRYSSAFSLVELSIVLVILGLLVGGVLSGQSLIRAAALRSVTNDYSRYSAAVNTFKDKYFPAPATAPVATVAPADSTMKVVNN